MNTASRLRISALMLCLCAGVANAVPIQVTLQGQLIIDEIVGQPIFDIFDISTPLQLQFQTESDLVQTLAAGTPIVSGASFSVPVHLISASNITAFNANFGSKMYDLSDLLTLGLGSTGSSFNVLLFGDLSSGPMSGVSLQLVDERGALSFGSYECGVLLCSILNSGGVQDYLTGGTGEVIDVTADAQLLSPPPTEVPEPGTLGLLGFGMVAIAAARRRRSGRSLTSNPAM